MIIGLGRGLSSCQGIFLLRGWNQAIPGGVSLLGLGKSNEDIFLFIDIFKHTVVALHKLRSIFPLENF